MKNVFMRSLLLCFCIMCSIQGWATEFEENGIGYSVLSDRDNEVAVVKRIVKNEVVYYTGDVHIPTAVSHNGTTYTVTVIANEAFYNCTALTSVDLPAQLDSIAERAFNNCKSLTSLVIPGSTRFIGASAFSGCSALSSLSLEEGTGELVLHGVTYSSIDGIFYQSPIDTLHLGRNLVFSGNYQPHFKSVKNIVISDGVTSLVSKEFQNCDSLKSVVFGRNVEQLGSEVFSGCTSLKTVDARSEKLRVIPNNAFNDNKSLLSIALPSQLDSIGANAFRQCKSLTSLVIPGSTRFIGASAFSGCSALSSLSLEEGTGELVLHGVTYSSIDGIFYQSPIDTLQLGRNLVFSGNYQPHLKLVKNIVISSCVTSICDKAFDGCNDLVKIFAPWRTPFTINENVFYSTTYSNATLVVPDGTIDTYKATTSWNKFLNIETFSFTMTVETSEGGNVELSNDKPGMGESVMVTLVPEQGYLIESLKVNGVDVTENISEGQYVIVNIMSNQTIVAKFKANFELVTIGSLGEATYCSDRDLNFASVSGMRALIASGFNPDNGNIILTRVTDVPAGTGLMLRGEPGTYRVPYMETNFYYSNLLVGTNVATDLPTSADGYYHYILMNGKDGVLFYLSSGNGQLAAHRAYLRLPISVVGQRRAIGLQFDDETTGVQELDTKEKGAILYDLQGRRVEHVTKGIYIKDGKRIVIK